MAQTRDALMALLDRELAAGRLAHVRRVAVLARSLAVRFGVDPDRAELAGLGHDRARLFSRERLLTEARRLAIPLLPEDERDPLPRLHGAVAARLLRDELGLDPEVLRAIESHTLGRPGMTPLEQVVFVADFAEPGRGEHPRMLAIRETMRHDLPLACRLACDATLMFLLESRHPIHPLAVQTRNWLLEAERSPLSC